MPEQSVPEIIPEITKWLDTNWKKIYSFWLYADWRNWARYDLYSYLSSSMGAKLRDEHPRWDYMVSHGVPLWGDDEPEVDLTIVPAADQVMKSVAIWICAARPGENDTSFPDFAEKFEREWKLVQDLTQKYGGGDMEGGKLLFVGIGEQAYEDEEFDIGGLKPEVINFQGTTPYEGAVYMYYLWMDLPEAKTT